MTGRTSKIPATILSRITKVFITNLPDKCSGKDLSEFIREYGDIYDIYIARKRDKFGNRFGFVSFLDVKDSKEIIRKIRNTCIGECWLKANIARFTLEEGEIRPDPEISKKKSNGEEVERNGDKPPSSFFNGTRSFTDTLLGRQGTIKNGKTVSVDDNATAFTGVHGRALVVRLIDLDALKNIYIILNDLCPGKGKIQYLGGLSVLITFEDSKTAFEVRDAAKDVLGRFSSIDLWEGQIFAFERLAWVKIVGVPLHLLSSQIINTIGGSVGKVIHTPSRSDEEGDLSYDHVGIIIGDGKRIEEEITVTWKDKKFSVWVTEDQNVWVPEFYKVPTPSDDDCVNDDVNVDSCMHGDNEDEQVNGSPESVAADHSVDGQHGLNGVINDGIDGDIIANYEGNHCEDETPMTLENNQDFTPGQDFDFEANCIIDGPEDFHGPSINKRKKKGGLGSLGQINPAYSSSLEKTKVGKKYRVQENEDPFGLDPLLGLSDRSDLNDSAQNERLDLNLQPNAVELGPVNSHEAVLIKNTNGIEDPEVEATIVMGNILGAVLSNSHVLIQDSIATEGLQGVKK